MARVAAALLACMRPTAGRRTAELTAAAEEYADLVAAALARPPYRRRRDE